MKRVLLIAAIAVPVLLALSYPWRDAKHGPGAILSGIGWFGFLLALITVIIAATGLGLRKLRTRRT